jgi:hypothetical protein
LSAAVVQGGRLEDRAAAAVQFAAYRLGWSRLPVEQFSAGFQHVAAKETISPGCLLDEVGLLALVTGES